MKDIVNYQRTNLAIVKAVILSGMDDLVFFGDCVLGFINSNTL